MKAKQTLPWPPIPEKQLLRCGRAGWGPWGGCLGSCKHCVTHFDPKPNRLRLSVGSTTSPPWVQPPARRWFRSPSFMPLKCKMDACSVCQKRGWTQERPLGLLLGVPLVGNPEIRPAKIPVVPCRGRSTPRPVRCVVLPNWRGKPPWKLLQA